MLVIVIIYDISARLLAEEETKGSPWEKPRSGRKSWNYLQSVFHNPVPPWTLRSLSISVWASTLASPLWGLAALLCSLSCSRLLLAALFTPHCPYLVGLEGPWGQDPLQTEHRMCSLQFDLCYVWWPVSPCLCMVQLNGTKREDALVVGSKPRSLSSNAGIPPGPWLASWPKLSSLPPSSSSDDRTYHLSLKLRHFQMWK